MSTLYLNNISGIRYSGGEPIIPYKDSEKSREAKRRYRESHRELLRQKNREYRVNNRDKILEKGRRYRKENRIKILEYQSREDVRERSRKNAREWRKNNREYALERDKEYYETHKDILIPKMVEYTKKWRKNNPNKYKVRNQMRAPSVKNKKTGKCKRCGKTTKTQIHHIRYNVNNPLKDTIELCINCHKKEHFKGGG